MVKSDLTDVCFEATAWIGALGQGDADDTVSAILDHVVTVLRNDARMPGLSRLEWRLLFADVEVRAREDLGALIDNHVELTDAVKAIVREIEALPIQKKARRHG